MENTNIIYDFLKKTNTPLKGGEISELTSLDKKVVDQALKSLLKEGKIHSPKRCYYSVK